MPRPDAAAAPWPAAVGLLALALLAAYAGELRLGAGPDGDAELAAFLHDWGLVPRALTPGRWVTFATALFLHAGLVHVASNVAFLVAFGRRVERMLGSARFLALYLGAGLAAEALHVAIAPRSFVPVVGASGAVAGVLGAWWRLPAGSDAPDGAAPPAGRGPALAVLALWLAAQATAALRAGEAASVAGWAHLGGFAAGALGVRLLTHRRDASA